MPLSMKATNVIATGERLREVVARVDEVDATVTNLLATDPLFAALPIGEQATVLEHKFIFGPLGISQHFLKSDWYLMLKAKSEGRMPEIRAEAVAIEAAEAIEEPLEGGEVIKGK
jgi:hypothetical protein